MDENLLVMFVKYPEPGQVKSRLALTLGDRKAAQVYKSVTEELISAVVPSSSDTVYDMAVAYSPADAAQDMRTWLRSGIQLMPQSGANLGERLQNAFAAGFADGYARIIIIGSDCPAVTRELVRDALHRLKIHEVVIGPAADGGYYLIGLSRSAPELFTNIDWSTEHVFDQTIEKCDRLGLAYTLLPPLRDIDRPEDLEYYRQQGLII
jgi:rSAM/selenodomain-associated transferase 1